MSLQVQNLYPTWKIEVTYNIGDRVLYEDVLYKVLINHTSQEGWEPNIAPKSIHKGVNS